MVQYVVQTMPRLKYPLKKSLVRLAHHLPRCRSQGIRCLLYHRITPAGPGDPAQQTVPLPLFKAQMSFLSENGYRVIPCSEALNLLGRKEPPPPKGVCLTFDDGDPSVERLALPVLAEHRFPATVFLVAGREGGRDHLTREEARRLIASGWVEPGCHSLTHERLKGLPPGELDRQTVQAKKSLEEGLGRTVPLFAYPFGSFGTWDRRTMTALKRAGFQGAFTSVFGVNTDRTPPFLLRRCRVSWQQEIPEFRLLLEGAYDWYSWAQRLQALGR